MLLGFTAATDAAIATEVALASLRLCGETPTEPFAPLPDAATQRIRAALPASMPRSVA